MKKLTSLFRTLFIISLHVVTLPVLAQDPSDPGFPFENDPGNDPAAAPIDQWILPMVIIGIAVIYYFIKKKRQSIT